MGSKKVLNFEKVIKKASVEFCPEVPQIFFEGKQVSDETPSLKFYRSQKVMRSSDIHNILTGISFEL